jgi:hypothetical protein
VQKTRRGVAAQPPSAQLKLVGPFERHPPKDTNVRLDPLHFALPLPPYLPRCQSNTPLLYDRDDQLQSVGVETPATASDHCRTGSYRPLVVAFDARLQGNPQCRFLPRTVPSGLEAHLAGKHKGRRYVFQSLFTFATQFGISVVEFLRL